MSENNYVKLCIQSAVGGKCINYKLKSEWTVGRLTRERFPKLQLLAQGNVLPDSMTVGELYELQSKDNDYTIISIYKTQGGSV